MEQATFKVDTALRQGADRGPLRLRHLEERIARTRGRQLILAGLLQIEVSFQVDLDQWIGSEVAGRFASRYLIVALEVGALLAEQLDDLIGAHRVTQRQHLVDVEDAKALVREEVERSALQIQLLLNLAGYDGHYVQSRFHLPRSERKYRRLNVTLVGADIGQNDDELGLNSQLVQIDDLNLQAVVSMLVLRSYLIASNFFCQLDTAPSSQG